MARREFTGRLIAAGPTRTLTGEAGRYTMTAEAVRQAVDDGLFRGLACFVDHSAGRPSLRRLLGVWDGVEWDAAGGAAVGRLRVYETAATRPVVELLEQTLDEAEPPDVGVSLVFYPRLAADGRTVTGIVMVESADVVMFPASVSSRIVGEVAHAKDAEEAKSAKEEASHAKTQREKSSLSLASLRESSGERPGRGGAARAGERGGEEAIMTLTGWGAGPMAAGRPVWLPAGETERQTTPDRGKTSHSDHRSAEVEMDRSERSDMDTLYDDKELNDMNEVSEQDGAPLALAAAGDGAGQGLRRVRLVAATPAAAMTPARPSGGASREAADGPALSPQQVEEKLAAWAEACQRSLAGMVIHASGLPAPVQARLLDAEYESYEAVEAAVAGARAELAALNEAGGVKLGGVGPGWGKVRRTQESATHREGATHRISLRDGLDEARELVGFFFGAADAPEPPPNLRSFADLYVALTGDVHFRGVFDGDRAQFSGATTSTLPNLAVDAMNRVIVQQFQALEHYRWYERISTAEPNDGTLQAMKWITLGGIGNLPTVSEGAAYTELSVADVKETAAFVKRGGYVGITREMIKNSNIMQLQAIPRALAAAAVRTRSAAVAGLFTAGSGVGPTLAQDSKALFHADHGNLATTALGTDATAWRAARAECFQQTEVGSGKALGVFPRYLLVPAELYDTALSILGYGEGMPAAYAPEALGRGFADPRPIPLVVPDWSDDNNWAYVVDPAVFPVIQMSYSQSPGGRRHPIPELFAVVSETSGLMFSNDILPIKVRDEFALGVNGARGIGKRNVS